MAVPRNRLSNSRKRTRRAHHAKKIKQLISCDNCKALQRPHTVCSSCGRYAGRVVFAAESA